MWLTYVNSKLKVKNFDASINILSFLLFFYTVFWFLIFSHIMTFLFLIASCILFFFLCLLYMAYTILGSSQKLTVNNFFGATNQEPFFTALG